MSEKVMGRINDLKGRRFGRLLVLGDSGKRSGRNMIWTCYCDCGNFTMVQSGSLASKHTSSCGCLQREVVFKHGDNTRTNGKARLYHTWDTMKQRCNNKNNSRFKNYGRRGIKVCPEWKKYIPFKAWALSSGYADTLTIDRIDNDGDYCPENCQWLTMGENSRKGSK